MARDMQRAKPYRAEREAFPGFSSGTEVMEFADACRYVAMVWRSPWTRRTFPLAVHAVPRVKDGRGTRIARGGLYRINLPRWARTKPVMLHEIAHSLTVDRLDEGVHGRTFARNFLALVQHFLGRDAAKALRASFRKHRVRYNRKRRISPEALAALRSRGAMLAAALTPPREETL